MTNKVFTILFMTTVLMAAGIVASTLLIQEAEAKKAAPTYIQKYGPKTGVCGDKLCSDLSEEDEKMAKLKYGLEIGAKHIAQIKQQRESGNFEPISAAEQRQLNHLQDIAAKIAAGERISRSEMRMAERAMEFLQANQFAQDFYGRDPRGGHATPEQTEVARAESAAASPITSVVGERVESFTLTSVQDPGLGHESHQLMVVLPPSENVYFGRMTFSASEPVQYVMLHGPLADEDIGGQPTWTPDNGQTHYALTLVDQGARTGGWMFAGNAIALHSMNDKPFTATVSVAYREAAPGQYREGTVASGTVHSMQDPGIGHEGHSLALILEPRDRPYRGSIFAYAASESVDVVALHGPLAPGENMGQPTWTPDGETHYALTIVTGRPGTDVYTTFTGNALALHTMNPNGFTASYSVAAGQLN